MNTYKITQAQSEIVMADMASHIGTLQSQGIISSAFTTLDPTGDGSIRAMHFLASKAPPAGAFGADTNPVEAACRLLTTTARKRNKRDGSRANNRMTESALFLKAVKADEQNSFEAAWGALVHGLDLGASGAKIVGAKSSAEWLERFAAR